VTLNRDESIDRVVNRSEPWDVAVIGGGATGVAIALDAASRGLAALLVERDDFGKGTSSRSTKLVHGGVRYLEQGNITLVRDALHEREILRRNAPLLVHDLPFFIPCRSLFQRFYFWFGLKLYDLLAGRDAFGSSRSVPAKAVEKSLPTLRPTMHRGGVIYHDGQFDDARLLIHMARTAAEQGACLVNYMSATEIVKNAQGRIDGLVLQDQETGARYTTRARCVINAAGPFSDAITRLDDPASEPRVAASQGVHIVLDREFFPGETALIVPRTSDGRVLFLIPWRNHVVVGTTDTPIPEAISEPTPQEPEIEFLLATAGQYLSRPPARRDVRSLFTGIRPLVKGDRSSRTASLSRDHSITVSDSGLVSIRGGKWTTVRKMAEDCVNAAVKSAGLRCGPCVTRDLPLHPEATATRTSPAGIFLSPDQEAIDRLAADDARLDHPAPGLPDLRRADVVWAARVEMARTVEDVLARRTRWLFLDSAGALAAAPLVATWLAEELGRDADWAASQIEHFRQIASHYTCPGREP
jgi:glycerol-3-phosphate dehydrogenase